MVNIRYHNNFSRSTNLCVGPEPRKGSVLAGSGHGAVQLVGEEEGQRKELRGLVGSVTEHDTFSS